MEIRRKYDPSYLTEDSPFNWSTHDIADSDIPDPLRLLKPDIIFFDRDIEEYKIIEVTIPYNQQKKIDEEIRNTTEEAQNEKEKKYKNLEEFITANTPHTAKVYTIVVSSLGHITRHTLQNLTDLFGKRGKKIAENISLDTIRASATIYERKNPIQYGYIPLIEWVNSIDNNVEENNLSEVDGIVNNRETHEHENNEGQDVNDSNTPNDEQDAYEETDANYPLNREDASEPDTEHENNDEYALEIDNDPEIISQADEISPETPEDSPDYYTL